MRYFKCLASVIVLSLFSFNTGCDSGSTSYSLLASGQSFKQATVNGKIDVLWVVDNSRSMSPLQDNMTANFNSFISNFQSKNFDFRLAVTTTDAYLAQSQYANDPSLARFRDGVGNTHSGIFTMLPSTLDLTGTFLINASQGSGGSSDENAFASIETTLSSSLNMDFLRPKSFLAVVILSDEDDFSDPNRPENSWTQQAGIPDHDYNNPGLLPVSHYITYLDGLTGTTGALRRYSVSALTVMDSACQQQHVVDAPTTVVGKRYMDIAGKTDGELGSVCDVSYAHALEAIQKKIVELGTQFYLTGVPVVSTIRVGVNGAVIPQDSLNGWTYNAAANSIVFHGGAVPGAGANVSVVFDPAKLQF